jgi:hypothetical protein
MELTFDKCPNCKSTNQVAGSLCKQEQEKGKLNKGEYIPLYGFQAVIANPNKQSKIILARSTVPVVTAVFDICADCGTFYAVKVQTQTVAMETEVQQKPSPLLAK